MQRSHRTARRRTGIHHWNSPQLSLADFTPHEMDHARVYIPQAAPHNGVMLGVHVKHAHLIQQLRQSRPCWRPCHLTHSHKTHVHRGSYRPRRSRVPWVPHTGMPQQGCAHAHGSEPQHLCNLFRHNHSHTHTCMHA